MKNLTNLLVAASFSFLTATATLGAESVSVLLQKGIFAEETEGNLDAAIQIYEKIIGEAAANRTLIAQAQYRLGMCHLKKGKKEEAGAAFRRIVEQFAGEAEVVADARNRLAELGQPASALVIRRVWSGTNASGDSISPDGRYLAFIDWDTGNLAVRDMATGQDRRLTEKGSWEKPVQYAESCAFSRDGKQIAYTWYGTNKAYALHLMGIEDQKSRLLVSLPTNGWLSAEDWSPDGKAIAVFDTQMVGTNWRGRISVVNAADGAVRPVSVLGTNIVSSLRFSPDGNFLGYTMRRNRRIIPPARGTNDIFLVDMKTGTSKLVVEHVANEQFVGWDPRGSEILFTSERRRVNDLWSVKVKDGQAGGPPKLVKAEIGDVEPIGVTRDGSIFYAARGGDEPDYKEVYTASVDFETGKVLSPLKRIGTRVSGSHDKPEPSPDGRYLFYRSGSKTPLACRLDLETGEVREFANSQPWAIRIGWWFPSPDNKQVLVALQPGFGGAGRGLYLMNCQTGELLPFALEKPDIDIGLLPRPFIGSTVTFWRRHTDKKVAFLVRRDLNNSQETECEVPNAFAPPEPWWMVFLPGDGKTLFFVRRKPADNVHVAVAHDVASGKQREFFTFKDRRPLDGIYCPHEGGWIRVACDDERKKRTYVLFSYVGIELREMARVTVPEGFEWTKAARTDNLVKFVAR